MSLRQFTTLKSVSIRDTQMSPGDYCTFDPSTLTMVMYPNNGDSVSQVSLELSQEEWLVNSGFLVATTVVPPNLPSLPSTQAAGSPQLSGGPVAVTGEFFQPLQPVSISAPVEVTGDFFQPTQPVSLPGVTAPGQAPMAASLPVVIATDQPAVPVAMSASPGVSGTLLNSVTGNVTGPTVVCNNSIKTVLAGITAGSGSAQLDVWGSTSDGTLWMNLGTFTLSSTQMVDAITTPHCAFTKFYVVVSAYSGNPTILAKIQGVM